MVNFTASAQGSKGSLAVFFEDGTSKTISSEHPAYSEAVTYLLTTPEHDEPTVRELLNPALRIGRALQEIDPKFGFDLYTLSYDGLPLSGPLADVITERLNSKNPDWERFVRFAASLERNPSFTAKQGLYSWVAKNGLHILPDGRFVGHKGVRADGLSAHSGPNNFIDGVLLGKANEHLRVPNFVGTVVSKRRADVDDSKQACATGLHIGTYSYAESFAGPDSRFLTVAVWPEDAVGGDQGIKIRVSRYEVLSINEARSEFETGDYVHVDRSEEVSAYELALATQYPTKAKAQEFSGEQWAEYTSLPSVGRTLYDNIRTQFGKSHDAAFAVALETYGTFQEFLAKREEERAAEAAAAAKQAEIDAQATSVRLAEEAAAAEDERVRVAQETLEQGRSNAEQDVVDSTPSEASSDLTLAENAALVPDLATDLANTSLGHKPLARKWSHLTTESSVRRYRKAQGVSLSLSTRVRDAVS